MPEQDGPDQPVIDQLAYGAAVAGVAEALAGPVLQIGARSQVIDKSAGDRQTWRSRMAGTAFIGADLDAGENVDAVFDICWPLERIQAALAPAGHSAFGAVICAHLLEHVKDPFQAARNIMALTAPGGRVFIQVPWVQGFHGFPDDYWRISASGLELLFEGFRPVDLFVSGGSSDVAYRIRRGGEVALDRDIREAEAGLFQVLLQAETSKRLAAQAGKLHLSRGYLPIMVINFLAERPASPQ